MAQGPLAVVIAIDSNILVRVAVADNTAQTQRVGKLFAENNIWISKTVLLEAEWVLRGTYRLTAPAILHALRTVTAFTNVHVEDPVAVDAALALFAGGLEFADAMHLASGLRQSPISGKHLRTVGIRSRTFQDRPESSARPCSEAY